MTVLIERLQSHMRRSATLRYEVLPVPPFTVFLHRSDPLRYFNYAISARRWRTGMCLRNCARMALNRRVRASRGARASDYLALTAAFTGT